MDYNTRTIRIQGCVPDGAQIVKYRPASGANNDMTYFVLCEWREEYVTWFVDITQAGAHHGHYHRRDFEAALTDYHSRK